MSVNDLKIISAPVIVVLNDTETEYDNGAAACSAFKPYNRLKVKVLSVRNNKIIVQFTVWESGDPFNLVGEGGYRVSHCGVVVKEKVNLDIQPFENKI